ncbi:MULTISPECIES: glycoside hydrolase family 1 protein [unclassified Breznakia]|uniref:glycoside hydrolase family 1 protein n=1 Tax=unclassified Breznakia TaxID=2623764 RepID=UPI002474A2CE|nr:MULTISPECIES: glycoside hydrolase family 1 protein [unclassified Breznakia]MDH6367007.1 beta-glucosidase/6-phospho-beta-glucosidase/beta-galactosidase [Breznakia sp. PH1-1]MDH6404221.1 beta-glucosidase/6-phospho-beta-glucosidase/beta-galactosidase [Breznakia sp. PF1-11]MDH6411894.1 beta-glucosidase/6-phospho-beta-glucosidase/beta-galactosidase [Breznakia sp. PFB1-11]MDH6414209.1 beta-glucosidase/6-phospho-beta-glucosidase/beta-galactosidase [Breznakia sp. PFB1-14]MDH6415967.1 beta-glucosida
MDKKFLWGGASASYQCEGAWDEDGRVPSLWDVYLHDNQLEDGDVASDHYHQYEQDIAMMAEGGQTSYRFSLAWPRIIKNKEGEINPKGIDFYNRLIDTCHKYNIEPFVTLYHWDLPQYWEDEGGWLNKEVATAFAHFARVCFDAFGDRVTYWSTFNEPKWFVVNGYFIGNYPPGCKDIQKTMIAAYNVMYASALGVKVFKEGGYPGSIGIVHSYTPVDGVDDTIETQIAVRNADNYSNNWVLDTAAFGEFPIDLITRLSLNYDVSFIKSEDLKIIKENTVDFIGLNYYARALVKPYTEGETQLRFNHSGKKGEFKILIKDFFEQVKDPNSEYTQWDTEIYPKGLQDGLIKAYEKYKRPLFVTENGVGVHEDVSVDMVQDDYRISFMHDHINAIMNAQDQGVDVRGYYAWSPFDLYSWMNGVKKRYGLVAIDFDDQLKRKPKASYYWFKDTIACNAKNIKRKEL